MENKLTLRKIRKGHYIDDLWEFEFEYDPSVEGQMKWAVFNRNQQLEDEFYSGYDGLYQTLTDATEYVVHFLENDPKFN